MSAELMGRALIGGIEDRHAPVDMPDDRMTPADAIAHLIASHDGNIAAAARSVGMKRETLRDYSTGRRSIPGTTGRKLTAMQAANLNLISNMRAKFSRRDALSPGREAKLRAAGSAGPNASQGGGRVVARVSGNIAVAGYPPRARKNMAIYENDLPAGALGPMVDAYLAGGSPEQVFAAFAQGMADGWQPAPPLDVTGATGGGLMI